MPAVNATMSKECTTKDAPTERAVPRGGGGANSRCLGDALMLQKSIDQLNGQAHALHTGTLQCVHGFDDGFVLDGAIGGDHHGTL